MSNARIPKKEYQDLLNELFGDLPDLNAFDCMEEQQRSPVQNTQLSIEKLNSTSNYTFQPNQVSTPIQLNRHQAIHSNTVSRHVVPTAVQKTTPNQNGLQIENNSIEYSVNPLTFSPLVGNVLAQTTEVSASATSYAINAPDIVSSAVTNSVTSTVVPSMPSAILLPMIPLGQCQGAVFPNGIIQIPQYQNMFVSVPTTMDLLNGQQIAIVSAPPGGTGIIDDITPINLKINKKPVIQKFEGYRNSRQPPNLFDHLKTVKPIEYVSFSLRF